MRIRNVILNANPLEFYDKATIDLDRVTPYQKEKLLSLCKTGCSFNVTGIGPRAMLLSNDELIIDSTPGIKVTKVIYHNPATIVFWSDGTKTVVKCGKGDTYDKEKGFYIACAKKLFGNDYKAVGRMNKALEMAEDKNG